MTKKELLKRIEELENQLKEIDELEEYKEECNKAARQTKIIIDSFIEQGLSQELAELLILESVRNWRKW